MTADAHAPEATEPRPAKGPHRRRRRAPAILISVALIALAAMWLTPWLDRDARNFVTVPLVAGTILLLGAWYLLFSGARWPRRLAVGLGGLALAGILALVFRLEGYTGDMKPKIVFRWAPRADELLAAPSAATGREATAKAVADLTRTTAFDYPQFLGPARVPIVTNVRLAREWAERPPTELWRQPIGGGWSAFAVVGDYAVTQEQRGDLEMVVCYEVRTGRVVWSHREPGRFTSVLGGDGPRATPTIHDGKVYVQSPCGRLKCLDGRDGSVVWSHDILDDNGAENIQWGRSGSPLVVDNLVIVSAGGPDDRSLVAYEAETGSPVWHGGSDVSSYSSPALATLCGIRQVLVVNQDWVVGHRLSDGAPLWRERWPGKSNADASASQPLPVGDDRVFLSKGYGIGCKLIGLSQGGDGRFSVDVLWRQSALMRTKLTNVVLRDGHVYGLSQGILECVELATGRRRWKRGRYGHGQVLLVHDLMLVTAETGEVALVEAVPERFRELGRFQALDGKTWNNPALSGPHLLVRNAEEAVCYELPLAGQGASADTSGRPVTASGPAARHPAPLQTSAAGPGRLLKKVARPAASGQARE